jgi:SAM-dependent methyltransferase
MQLPHFENPLLDSISADLQAHQIQRGMDLLMQDLQTQLTTRDEKGWLEWVSQCQAHPLRRLLHQDPFTLRAFAKPRGYAGDAELLDFMYQMDKESLPRDTTLLGRLIFEYTVRMPPCAGVRARRTALAQLLDQTAERGSSKAEVLSVASGHARELDLSSAARDRKLGRFVALDADAQSLAEVDRSYAAFGVETKHATIRQLFLATRLGLGQFDLIYSTGLYDYLSQPAAQRLTSCLFDMLKPGGRLVVANLVPGVFGQGYMESFMEWNLIYRNRMDLLDLAAQLPSTRVKEFRIHAEESETILFLELARRR